MTITRDEQDALDHHTARDTYRLVLLEGRCKALRSIIAATPGLGDIVAILDVPAPLDGVIIDRPTWARKERLSSAFVDVVAAAAATRVAPTVDALIATRDAAQTASLEAVEADIGKR
jgi:hypothetical protein